MREPEEAEPEERGKHGPRSGVGLPGLRSPEDGRTDAHGTFASGSHASVSAL